jgi:hypothetical protein
MTDVPIACSLTSEALRARRNGLLADAARLAESREDLPDGVRLRFRASADMLATLAQVIDAERQCCRFLRFALTVEPDGGPVHLEMTGPPGTRDFVTALFEA